MKRLKKPLKKLFMIACLLVAGSTVARAQVTVVATAGNMGPVVYPDLNSAFAAINAGTHQGAIGVGIGANTVEAGPRVLNSSGAGAATYTSVAINPIVDGVTVSCATATGRGVIELNGADNVTIDGDNPNSPGTNRNLTITNTAVNTTTYTSVVRIALSTLITSGDNDIVKNCILNGSATGRNIAAANSTVGSEHTTYGILVGGGASTVTNTTAPSAIASVATTIGAGITATSFTADNNAITACARGIAVQGSAVTVANLMTITNNVIGSATANNPTTVYSRGMTLQGFNNATIAGNTIQNMDWYVTTACMAIGLGEVSSSGTNSIVEKNIINHVWNRNTGTYGSYGINLAAGANITVRNNFIADISHDMSGGGAFSGTFGVFGIRVNTGTGHIIDYNSINLFGLMPGTAGTTMLSAAIGILNTGLTGIDCRNNILSNTLSGGTTSIANVSLFLPAGGTSAMNLTLNNNIYYSGPTATTQGIAQTGTTAGTGFYLASNFVPSSTAPATNLRSYTSALSAAGTNDNASFASTVVAPFISTTDLHINNLAANAPDADGKAVPIASITTDIDAAVRNAATPDIGADEFSLPNCAGANGGTITPSTQSVCAGFTTTMTSTGATTGNGISYQWMISATSGGPYVNVSGGSGATTVSYTTAVLSAGTYYYVLQTTCSFGPVTGLSNELTVTVNPSPTVTVTPNSGSICQPGGSSVTLTASGATTYSWLPIAGLSSPTVANPTASPASTTTYTVTGTTAGCTATATATITISETPSISTPTATPSSVCSGGNSQLNVSAGITSAYTLTNPAFSLQPCQANPGPVGDDIIQGNNAIGFNFTYYGTTYTQFAISTNGNIQIGDGSGNATNPAYSNQWTDVAIPNATVPNNMIALAWDDWLTSAPTDITWGVTGSAPNRHLVVCYNTTGRGNGIPDTLIGQIVLEETTNAIYLNISKKGIQPANTATQGIENQAGTAPSVGVPGRQSSAWSVNSSTGDTRVFMPSGGTPTYAWSPATFLSSTTIANPMANAVTTSTTYTVTATVGGCSSTGTVTITAGAVLTGSSNITPSPTVCTGSNVTLNAIPGGGGSPYTYSWSGPNSFTSTLQNPALTGVTTAQSGTYTLTITDACAATSVSQVTLTVNPLPPVAVTPTTATYCNAGPGVSLTGSGALAYFWGPSAGLSGTTGTTVTASPGSTTTYTVTGTDGNGCSATATTTITYAVAPSITSLIVTPSAICSGNNAQLSSSAGTTLSYTSHDTTLSLQACQSNAGPTGDDVVQGANPIGFTFNYYGVDYTSFGLSTNGNIQLGDGSGTTNNPVYNNSWTDVAIPNAGTPNNMIDLAWDDWLISAGQITWGVTGTAPNRKLIVCYNTTGRGSGSADTLNGQIVLNETSNVVDLSIIKKGVQPANTATQGMEDLTGSAASIAVPGRNNVAWSANNITRVFIPSGGTISYAWSPSTFLSSTTISNPAITAATSSTTYTLTVTSSGCTATGTAALTVNPLPTVVANASANPVCSGSPETLTGSGATTYTWSGGITDGVSFNPTSTNTYTVTGTDGNGCQNTGTVTLTVNSLPVVTLSGANNFCTGGSTVLTGTGGGTSQWYMNGSLIVGATTNTYTVTAPGEYNMTKTNLNGCTDSASVGITVVENPLPTVVANASATSVCSGSPEILTGSGATTYTWSGGVTDGVSFNPSSTNTYTVTGTDGNGCQNTDMVTVTVNALPTVVANTTATVVCSGSPVTLSGSGATSYTWTGGVMDAVAFNPTVTDTYTVTGTDANNCQNTDMVTVTVNPLPTVTLNFPTDTVCLNGGNVNLTGESPSGGIWSGNGVSGSVFDPTVPGIGFTLITYTYSDVNGCTAMDTSSLWVDVCNGIANHANLSNIAVFPNPNNGHFTVVVNHASGNGLLVITDALGQVISSENIVVDKASATKEIDLGAYASGIYFVRFTTSTSNSVQKVTIQR